MKVFLSILCVVAISVTAVSSLQCTQCFNITGNVCSAPASACHEDTDTCLSLYLEIRTGATQLFPSVTRLCGKKKHCNLDGSITTLNSQVQSKSSCCDSDSCPPPIPIMPEPNNTKNGLSCPACSARNATSCKADKMVECLGMETQCVTMYSIFTYKDGPQINTALSGCATQNVCDSGKMSFDFMDVKMEGDVKCTKKRPKRRLLL
ncbi:phospholipase A2 inhibitor gamma subunit B-like [Discoglossus pictus]